MAHRLASVSRLRWGVLLVVLGLALSLLPPLQAQTDVRYFPETGHYLRGVFRSFWEGNGSSEIFGFPITEEYIAPGTGRVTQYFERARFELSERNGQAYVELGRLGVEVTQNRVFPKVPPIENTAQRRYIPETGHIIQYGFKEIWETRGGERIFGFPISEEIDEVLEDGQWHTVQYFERTRFEYWPNRPPGRRVLFSNLGRILAPPELLPPLPPNAPPAGPIGAPQPQPQPTAPPAAPAPSAPSAPPIPASVNASVTPESGTPGTVFSFDAWNFQAGEPVGIWITAPDQSTFGADFQVNADNQGSIGYAGVDLQTTQDFGDGIWSFNAQGVRSGTQAIGYFRISRSGGGTAGVGDPNRLGVILHDQLTTVGEAFILPVAAPAGTPFIFLAGGFDDDEDVSSWITNPAGQSTPVDEALITNDQGIVEVDFSSAGFGGGIHNAVAQGRSSENLGAAAFKITNDYVAGPGTPRPNNVNGSATPQEGGAGTVFQIRGWNLRPNEEIELWVTDPTGAYALFPGTGVADSQGRIGYEPELNISTTADLPPGVYGIHFRGLSTGTRVDIYFTFTGGGSRTLSSGTTSRYLLEQFAPAPFVLPQGWDQMVAPR